ncbi:hypothetical protein B566_EDAN014357 [Ephemera danica]|nr:hypothetical protein B566_EDAN014357 [Ephemera danica]
MICTFFYTFTNEVHTFSSLDADCEESSIELRQTVSLIYDTLTVGSGTRDWSFRKLFGSGLSGPCPLATGSRIFVDITQNNTSFDFGLTPTPPEILHSMRGGSSSKLALYDLKKMHLVSMLNVAASYIGERVEQVNVPPVLYANRYVVGYGQEQGGIVTQLHNTHWQPLDVIYMENIPWFLPVYLHTLTARSGGRLLTPAKVHFVPGRERQRPYQLEVALRVPARSITTLSIKFDYIFLKWQEYPPDANHGFYVGGAVITASLPVARNYTGIPQDGSTILSSVNASRSSGYLLQLRTETLLVSLPTPDFSMPYNVICLACTVVALAFGPLHNITTKRLLMKDIEQRKGALSWIKSKFSRKAKTEDVKPKED